MGWKKRIQKTTHCDGQFNGGRINLKIQNFQFN